MSWFKRSPRRNEPQKQHVYHPPHPTPPTRRVQRACPIQKEQTSQETVTIL